MKILVDENIPMMTVQTLQQMGHDVKDIRGTVLEGLKDSTLWELAQEESRLLITTDKGFAQRRHEKHQGVLIVRLRRPNRRKIHGRALQAINQFDENEWPGLVVIMRDMAQSTWRKP
jgi:predicted nuclease of predicted toxin-antitoxin system